MNTLFIVLDTLRRDYLECYGNPWVQTPNIARLAQRGVVFDNHWVGSLPCMPARREFMTGRYNFIYRGWGPIEPHDDVLPRELRGRGVFSHLLTDHDHYFKLGGENYHTAFNTWEFFRGQEFDPWVSLVDAVALPEGHMNRRGNFQTNFKNRQRQQAEEDFSGPRTAQAAVDWIEANRAAKGAWFLQAEFFDPHEPFYCMEKYRTLYGDTWDGPLYDWPTYREVTESPAAVEHIRKCYAGLLTMTDPWIGKILDKLEETGLFDDTLIVLTTDHGTLLAEHGYWMKNFMPVYNEIVRLPLIMKLPGNAHAGERRAQFTQTIDLMPTFLDWAGVPPPPHVQGRSLRPVFEGWPVRADGIFGYFGKATNVTDGRYVYMRNPVNADGGPLHAYTAMPVGPDWGGFPRKVYDRMETGRYFGHTYNLPLYKIPALGEVPQALPGREGYRAQHQLFDVLHDPQQLVPLHDAALETHFVERIAAHLRAGEAPAEQYTRLGMNPP